MLEFLAAAIGNYIDSSVAHRRAPCQAGVRREPEDEELAQGPDYFRRRWGGVHRVLRV